MIVSCSSIRATALLLIAALSLFGCAGAPRFAEVPLQSSYTVSRAGLLHYKVPVGWFDATSDSQSVATEIWLVKNDYAAMISVSEIVIDTETRQAIKREGLIRLASLSISLSGSDGSATLIDPPETLPVDGTNSCSYTVFKPISNDTVRVVLIPAGERVFEVVALTSGKQRRVSTREVFSAQQSFLRGLRQ